MTIAEFINEIRQLRKDKWVLEKGLVLRWKVNGWIAGMYQLGTLCPLQVVALHRFGRVLGWNAAGWGLGFSTIDTVAIAHAADGAPRIRSCALPSSKRAESAHPHCA